VLDEHPVTGDFYGVDPIMGAASVIACNTFVDEVVQVADSARAEDGHDATCLRIMM
jgi:hypothetical protein